MPEPLPPKITTWTDASGRSHTVRTYKKSGETTQAWQDRHDADVAFWKTVYPEA